MMDAENPSQIVSFDGQTLTVRVKLELARRGGRKLVIVPENCENWAPPTPKRDSTLIKAIARAHRWQQLLETRQDRSLRALAAREGITDAYIRKLRPLTSLAPDIITAILDGRQPKGLQLSELLRDIPLSWEEQRRTWGVALGWPTRS